MKKTITTKSQQGATYRSEFCWSLQTDSLRLYSNTASRLSDNSGITYEQRQ